MIPDRSLEVLRAIVQDDVASKEPVGSKALVERHAFGVSAATIRNDMAILEDEELIVAPHTSSGRVPTDKGYRMFVDQLAEVKPLSAAERQAIESFLSDAADLDDILGRTVKLLSQLTHQVAMVQYPSLGRAAVRHIELIPVTESRLLVILITDSGRVQQHVVDLHQEVDADFIAEVRARLNAAVAGHQLTAVTEKLKSLVSEVAPQFQQAVRSLVNALVDLVDEHRQEKLLLAGTSNLVKREQDFPGSISPVLEAIEEQVVLLRLMSELQVEHHGVGLRIGRENNLEELSATSLVVSGYENQGSDLAKLGVIGPTRMDYSSNIAAVRAVARYLSKALGSK